MSPRPKGTPFNRDNRAWLEEQRAKRLEKADAKAAGSWWVGKDRETFQKEVARRHQCVLNSRNPSVRSLSKVI